MYIHNIKLDLQKTIDSVSETRNKETEAFFYLVAESKKILDADKNEIEKLQDITSKVIIAFNNLSNKDSASIILVKTFIGIALKWINDWVNYLPSGYENVCKTFLLQSRNIEMGNKEIDSMFHRFSESINEYLFKVNKTINEIRGFIKENNLDSEIQFSLDESFVNVKIAEANTIISNFKSQKAEKSKGGCFIATACYGDYDHPNVIILRQYRDNTLSKSIIGRLFVSFYYSCSPPIARQIEKKEKLKSIIRENVILPIVKIIDTDKKTKHPMK